MYRIIPLWLLLLSLLTALIATGADSGTPITGDQYDSLMAAGDVEFQRYLETLFLESDGYLICGPMDPLFPGRGTARELYQSVRIICPDLNVWEKTLDSLKKTEGLTIGKIESYLHQPRQDYPLGYRGAILQVSRQNQNHLLQVNTVGQTRWLLWARDILAGDDRTIAPAPLNAYSLFVADHLYAVDRRWDELERKKAADYGVLDTFDLYREPPDYVISGYHNYKNFIARHAGISTDFASGIVAFIPNDSLLTAIKAGAPEAVYRNKEEPMLQHEYLEFFDRGGDVRVMKTLTKAVFDSLAEGEYFFAVGPSGKIRFGRELLREEVAEIELATGNKVPRANHAFLFHGSPVMTAGAFFIERDSIAHLAEVSAQSGHYFYSNVSPSIREDISVRSNEYLLTLGHFFNALDRLKIPYKNILIRKF